VSGAGSEQVRYESSSPQAPRIAMVRPKTCDTQARQTTCELAAAFGRAAHDDLMGVPETVRTGFMGRNAKVSARAAGGGQ
jgi:1,4-dihydroxy-2-naphthoyl-CoA synthase